MCIRDRPAPFDHTPFIGLLLHAACDLSLIHIYARQDRKAKAHDPISAKLVADLITAAGANRVLTMDLHAPQIQGFFNIPVDHLLGVPILAPHFTGDFIADGSDVVAVSPDFGSVTRARNFAERCGIPIAIIDKRRQQANVSEVMNIIGDVKGKRVILVDDMIDTAGTLCNGAKAVIERGGAKEVYACATHGVLSGKAMERIEASPKMCIRDRPRPGKSSRYRETGRAGRERPWESAGS